MVLMFIVLVKVYDFRDYLPIVMCASQLGLAPTVRLILGHSMPLIPSILTVTYSKYVLGYLAFKVPISPLINC